MSTGLSVALAIGAVLLAALLSGLGWLLGRAVARRDKREASDTSQGTALALLQYELANLRTKIETNNAELCTRMDREHLEYASRFDRLERGREALSQELAVVGEIVSSHTAWHERRDQNGPGVR